MDPADMPEDVIDLTAALVATASVNPGLDPRGTGEAALAARCAAWLERRGLEVRLVDEGSGRPSVIAVAEGAPGARTLLLNGHLDTVPPAPTRAPTSADHRPHREDGRLYGRGAYDMKSAVAAAMVVAARAARARTGARVVLTLVADEEFGSRGTEAVLADLAAVRGGGAVADGAIVVEPTGGEVVLAHRGFAWFECVVTGRAAHGSQPEEGADAIAHAGRLLQALADYGIELAARPAHALLASGTVRVSRIDGGTDAATVADRCVLTLERRFLPDEAPAEVEAELRLRIDAVDRPEGIGVDLRSLVARAAMAADPASPLAGAVLAAVASVDGAPARTRGEPFWTDAGLLAEAGVPVVLVGADGGGLHAQVEWVQERSVHRLVEVLDEVVRLFR